MIFRNGFFLMQIFEINKKAKMFWFFLALPLFPRERAFKRNKSRERNDNFINNGNAETDMPLQKKNITFALGRASGLLF